MKNLVLPYIMYMYIDLLVLLSYWSHHVLLHLQSVLTLANEGDDNSFLTF